MEGYRTLTSRFRTPFPADAHGQRNLRNVNTGGTGPQAQAYISEI